MPLSDERKAGRPLKLDELAAQKILTAVRNCNFESRAAQWAGISPRTLRRWKDRGETSKRKADQPFRDFVRRLKEASRAAEIEAATLAFQAAKRRAEKYDDPRGLIDLLRIRWRQRWSEKHQVEVKTKTDNSPEMADAIGEALMEKLKRLAQTSQPSLRAVETRALPIGTERG